MIAGVIASIHSSHLCPARQDDPEPCCCGIRLHRQSPTASSLPTSLLQDDFETCRFGLRALAYVLQKAGSTAGLANWAVVRMSYG